MDLETDVNAYKLHECTHDPYNLVVSGTISDVFVTYT